METQRYFMQKREIQNQILLFIENPNHDNIGYIQLTSFFNNNLNLQKKKEDLKDVCTLLTNITNECHRNSLFFNKIEQIILYLKKYIMSSFTNLKIYRIFQKCKLILFILIKNQIMKVDQDVFDKLSVDHKYYFHPELKSFYNEDKIRDIENTMCQNDPDVFINFDEKRQNGVNDSEICKIIRNDSIQEFVTFLNLTEIEISSLKIKPSIFETNPILYKSTDIMEYAAFYGSNKIIKYLLTKIEIPHSILTFSMHSGNPKTIHLFEEKIEEIDGKTNILTEAIKSHQNDIADYLNNNYKFDDDIIDNCFHYANFLYLPEMTESQLALYYLYSSKYNYLDTVKFLLKKSDIDLNAKI